jgi:hypothetical protein
MQTDLVTNEWFNLCVRKEEKHFGKRDDRKEGTLNAAIGRRRELGLDKGAKRFNIISNLS